ncbi:tetratricopeptide repeat protein [Zavarzinella formosa]|uniref:tetratricopeptide repeat protein n=1 Tax=Zavarzinella formosa TaxID=360055 RepID=UPI00030CAD72|nr:tetratricopeptide repeat protein [Zavarzinella formosa]
MRISFCILALTAVSLPLHAADADPLLREARAALKRGDGPAALKAAEKAVEAEPKNHLCYYIRGEVFALQRQPVEAIKDFNKSFELDKTFVIAINQRGGEQFKLGKVKESIEDFNTFLKASPKDEPAHWRRGISFYYAGKYDEGAKQFVDGQVAYGTDVENAFWHYLCVAKKEGIEKARKGILPIELGAGGKFPDTRVPMKEIYDLIRAKGKPADVMTAAENAKLEGEEKTEAMFYANLYVGLNYDAEGNTAKCREHMTAAVDKYKITHYMWDVANVHLKLMKKP